MLTYSSIIEEKKMALRIITISRQYGSGGRAIGKALADALGIDFYDKEILQKLAEKSGYTMDFIENQGEYKTNSALSYTTLGTNASMRLEPMISPTDSVVKMQNELIESLASSKPCVIIGRGADYLLRERNDVLNVFIYADEESRIKCIAEEYEKVSYEEAAKHMKQRDRMKKKHYRYYTDRQWGAMELYDICLNTTKLSKELAVKLLCQVYRELNNS